MDTALAANPPTVAEQLVRAGVRILQYRHKGPFTRSNWEDCCEIAELARRGHVRFIVNDRADVALLCGAGGVHLGQDDLPPQHVRRLFEAGSAGKMPALQIIGFSTHSVEQARAAECLPVDYLAIGPVFPTTTKKQADPVVGIETVRAVRAITRKPLVAIGGITLENAPAVIEAGADAVAVVRDLLAAPDIEARARQFLKVLGARCSINF